MRRHSSRVKFLWVPLIAGLLITGCATHAPVAVSQLKLAPGLQSAQVSDVHLPDGSASTALRYWLYLPKDYDADPTKRWPIVLFLHGAGERGQDLNQVAVHGPPKLVKNGRDFPFILVSPQCPSGERWHSGQLVELLQKLSLTLRVDTNRWCATGLSMGGYGSWELASVYPNRFAAVAPVCGGGQTIDLLLRNRPELKTLGVWAFHGSKDSVVIPSESQRMVDAFKQLGNTECKLTLYPEANHDSWTATYNNSELYTWLLKHHR
jgi:predicted peptidase